ncbi:hypothetical protein, partial [Dermacoccus nishinomiyaensis]|uniref:hypothetical protein n=1 Tax=Dermacoccus nishinomiyaensis TaxID=1274 RepID=UPI001C92DB6A
GMAHEEGDEGLVVERGGEEVVVIGGWGEEEGGEAWWGRMWGEGVRVGWGVGGTELKVGEEEEVVVKGGGVMEG